MEKKICKPCFGRGFRKIEVLPDVNFFPSQRPEEICSDISPVESFRIERDSEDPDSPVRIRSDISMLLHAAEDQCHEASDDNQEITYHNQY